MLPWARAMPAKRAVCRPSWPKPGMLLPWRRLRSRTCRAMRPTVKIKRIILITTIQADPLPHCPALPLPQVGGRACWRQVVKADLLLDGGKADGAGLSVPARARPMREGALQFLVREGAPQILMRKLVLQSQMRENGGPTGSSRPVGQSTARRCPQLMHRRYLPLERQPVLEKLAMLAPPALASARPSAAVVPLMQMTGVV